MSKIVRLAALFLLLATSSVVLADGPLPGPTIPPVINQMVQGGR